VTGGAGSIETALVRTLLKFNPQHLLLIDNNEGLHTIWSKILDRSLSTFIADIRDKETIEPLFEGADFVFYLAALKNLPMCEPNPCEAVKTNILGTKTSLMPAYARMLKR
jgi:FlaA1/EpsC-like NDP-sugar epimerase